MCFFKYKFIYFNWRLITLQYCIGFAIHQHESATGIHVFPILIPPSLLAPHTIPLGRLSAPAPSIQYHALNLDWHTHRGNQNGKRHVHPNVHHSTVYNSQGMEAT